MPRLRIDAYLARRFDIVTQNCWHVARDAWFELTGTDLGDRTPEKVTRKALLGRFESDVPTFTKLDGPDDPCIVLMRDGVEVVPHVGIFYRGKVLQMAHSGVSYLPLHLARSDFDSVEFYR